MKKIVWAGLVFCGLIGVQAEDLLIQSLDSNGQLVFNEVPYVVGYSVQETSSLIMPSWTPVAEIIASETGAITTSVALTASIGFFRVVAEKSPIPDGMVEILAGTNSGTDPDYDSYTLTVETFCIDEKEVSKGKWDAVYSWAISNGYTFDNAGAGRGLDHLVHTVNWYDCVKWCNARSEKEERTPCYTVGGELYKTGQSSPDCNFEANGYRLPTNEEWEYAARGGLSDKRFPWGDTITHDQANYYSTNSLPYDVSSSRGFHPTYDDDGPGPYTSPVGSFLPNGYGLYDMAGNIWEWCWDEQESAMRVIQSGGWNYYADAAGCRVAYAENPTYADPVYSDTGFRSVCR